MRWENRLDGGGNAGEILSLRTTTSAWERMRGLLGRAPLAADEALVIEPCNMVHTVGMRYPIDVVFADRAGRVLQVSAAVPPRRMRGCLRAARVVELRAGEAARRGWVVGTQLPFLSASKP